MIGFIRGKVDTVADGFCLIDVNGVGYRIFLATNDLSKLVVDEEVKLITYMSVREDLIALYGFFDTKSYDLFIKLLSVSGVGAKVALGILSSITPDSFYLDIKNKNIKSLVLLPGVGKKTAERLILELKDKIKILEGNEDSNFVVDNQLLEQETISDAREALIALGYNEGDIANIFKMIKNIESMSTQEIVKNSLGLIARRTK